MGWHWGAGQTTLLDAKRVTGRDHSALPMPTLFTRVPSAGYGCVREAPPDEGAETTGRNLPSTTKLCSVRFGRGQGEELARIEEVGEVTPSAAKRAWARLIKQVYEVDPLMCPRCAAPMRIIAFIEQPEVIEKILAHLGLWPAAAHSPPADVLGVTLPAAGCVAA
jgi:hypothetical protein